MKKLNHSRYIDAGAFDAYSHQCRELKETPTDKQKKFFKHLIILCNQNNIESGIMGSVNTRVEYAEAISRMILSLNAAGINIKGNDKTADYGITIKEDKYGNLQTTESIALRDNEVKNNE